MPMHQSPMRKLAFGKLFLGLPERVSNAQMSRCCFSFLYHFSCHINRPAHCYSSCFSTVPSSVISITKSKPFLFNYLIERCGLSETDAISALKRLPCISSSKKSDAILSILCQFGLATAHIRDCVKIYPPILVANIEKTLVPQFKLLQGLGLSGSDLALIVSKNPKLLVTDLNRRLIPCIDILKKFLFSDNKDVIQVLKTCKWFVYKDPSSRLLPNISLLESHGIVGSQLSMLLKRQPMLFVTSKSKLLDLVNKVIEMGIPAESRMFVYALLTLSSMNPRNLQQKFDLLRSYGMTEDDLKSMFKKAPSVFKTSKKKLSLGMEFYINKAGVDLSVLVDRPVCLMHSIEKRAMPRYRVLHILRSKNLLKKEPKLTYVMSISDLEFVKYILRFEDEAEELLAAYTGDNGQVLVEAKKIL